LVVIKHLKLGVKTSLLGVASVVLTAVSLVVLAIWQSSQYHALAQSEVDQVIGDDLDDITQSVFNLVRTENETVLQQLNNDLSIAWYMLTIPGALSFSDEQVFWDVADQETGHKGRVQLSKILLGAQWIGQNADPAVPTLMVDEIEKRVGVTVTLFQRLSAHGDMLRVATSLKTDTGRRAIGTYMPAIGADGTPNPVIASVAAGKTYQGRSHELDAWYISACNGIWDKSGQLAGMFCVSMKQKVLEARVRQVISPITVGKTGYVFVIRGKGPDRGKYVVSLRGERDGENIWESTDTDGRMIVQSIVKQATALKPSQLATERYRARGPGEATARWNVARIAYYEPWDWVIGTNVYEDEVQNYKTYLTFGQRKMTNIMIYAGVAITFLIGSVGIFLAWSITRPVRRMTAAAKKIIAGDLNQRVEAHSSDEIGDLAAAFNMMTERLGKTLEGLHKSEGFLTDIVENIPNMVFVQDGKTLEFVRVNKAGEALLGRTREQLIGRDEQSFAEIPGVESVIADDRAILRNKGMVTTRVETIRPPGKEPRILNTKKIPILDEKGEPRYLLGISDDITDRLQAEQEAVQLNSALERQVADLSQQLQAVTRELETVCYSVPHDVRAPLRSIDGFSQALLDDYTDMLDEQGKDYLTRVRRASQRMSKSVSDLLTLSQLTHYELQNSQVDLSELAAEACRSLRATGANRKVDVIVAPNLTAKGDYRLLRMVMENLLGNAWKFTSKKSEGRIEFGVIGPPDPAMTKTYYVRDNGIGFDPLHLNKLFVAFHEIHASSDFEGHGIGLATVQYIIARHGGLVWAEGSPNQGATFFFTLP
jgi:PAS domain S-box-containing protein